MLSTTVGLAYAIYELNRPVHVFQRFYNFQKLFELFDIKKKKKKNRHARN